MQFTCHPPRAALRIGPYLSKSRKRRRHRLRQYRTQQRQNIEAIAFESTILKHDPETGLDLLVTTTHDKRTGQKRDYINIIGPSSPVLYVTPSALARLFD